MKKSGPSLAQKTQDAINQINQANAQNAAAAAAANAAQNQQRNAASLAAANIQGATNSPDAIDQLRKSNGGFFGAPSGSLLGNGGSRGSFLS